MKTLITSIFMIVSITAISQTPHNCDPEEGDIYKLVEDMPHPRGCKAETHNGICLQTYVNEYIQAHPDYQDVLASSDTKGSVNLTYTVGTNGCISNVLVRRETCKGCGDKIGEILKSMPLWKPGVTLEAPVRVRQHVTVKIEEGSNTVKH